MPKQPQQKNLLAEQAAQQQEQALESVSMAQNAEASSTNKGIAKTKREDITVTPSEQASIDASKAKRQDITVSPTTQAGINAHIRQENEYYESITPAQIAAFNALPPSAFDGLKTKRQNNPNVDYAKWQSYYRLTPAQVDAFLALPPFAFAGLKRAPEPQEQQDIDNSIQASIPHLTQEQINAISALPPSAFDGLKTKRQDISHARRTSLHQCQNRTICRERSNTGQSLTLLRRRTGRRSLICP
jgi:hypothetical protein